MEVRKIEIFSFIEGYLQCLKVLTENIEDKDLIGLAITGAKYKYNTPIFRNTLKEVIAELESE